LKPALTVGEEAFLTISTMTNIILPREFSKEILQKTYSRVFRLYDYWSRLTESKASAKVLEFSGISDGEQILEIAVGTGLVFEQIVKQNKNGMNVGIDLSPGMLSRARKRLKYYDPNHFCLQIGSAYQIPYKANTFDLVVNNFMFDLLPEKDFILILKEFNRVLKPSGRAVISSMTFGKKKVNQFWYWVARYFPSILTGCRPVSLQSYLPEAGFSEVKVEILSQCAFATEVILAKKESLQEG
jgi:ubiquinone/menaquinone biosynthesis C-methylase UbiE